MMRYVDVILPLPLQDFFTYAVSDVQAVRIRMGMRLLVPFGKSKTYAAMAVRVHDEKPDLPDSKIREVLTVLDDHPILLPNQLRLWRWIADYYMSPLGEVMNAALPAGLKAEAGYRPKTETCVRVGKKFASIEGAKIAIEMLRRMPRQLKTFQVLLSLNNDSSTGVVTREELMNEAHCTYDTVKRLAEQGFIVTYEHVLERLNRKGDTHPERIQLLSEAQTRAKRRSSNSGKRKMSCCFMA